MQKVIVRTLGLLLASIALTSAAETVVVEVFYPKQEAQKFSLELSGTVVAKQDAQLAPLEAGVVKAIFVEAGDKVTAGQPLLSLDDTLAKLRLAQAQASEVSARVKQQEAKRQYDEAVALAKRKVVSDSLLAERKASLANASAELSSSRAQLALQKEIVKRYTLTAPFDGVIAQRQVDAGEWINQQNQIFQLVSDQSLRLVVGLPQEHLRAMSQVPEVMVQVIPDVMPDMQYQLPLTKIVTVTESTSRTLQLRVDLPKSTELIPGMSARARFDLSGKDEKISWLPESALKHHPDGGKSVFTVIGDKIKRHNINLIRRESDQIAVTGLPGGAAVVVSGTELLRDNQAVAIVNSKGKR